ncbi:hypothetical protein KP806_00575 [Paenibacillus sp. N4]|uniref:hypothetical protein n=1 Tax=Paenibacillus vietnamensis TaxID=2590547 RepID=UPI001CD0A23E|nr:hypothetical protein [Paenibacillus vietnamensis]MCA0753528.1 hypothetical protein [Paenibacillus vietnamensis]
MFNKIMLWAFLLLPWPTLLFLGKKSVKRYMPVAVFVSLLVTILFEVAHSLKWWVLIDQIVPWGYITNVSFVYGIFLVGTIWIFHYTYRNFWLYLLVNAVIDGLFMFVLSNFFEGRIYNLVNFNQFQVFLLMVGLSLVIYGYQKWQEEVFKW